MRESLKRLEVAAGLLCLGLTIPAGDGRASPCFRPRPLPECTGFPITEFGVAVPGDAVWQLGYVRNVTPRIGLGGSGFVGVAFAGTHEGQVAVGLQGRARFWASRNWSVDVAPGVVLWNKFGTTTGFRGEVALSWKSRFGLSYAVESSRSPFESGFNHYAGLKAESVPGLIGGGIAGIVAGIVVLGRAIAG